MRTLVRAHPGTSRYIEIALFPIHLSENATKKLAQSYDRFEISGSPEE